jgi:hypothetical protein
MYSTCLDDPDEVSSVLQKSPMAGTFLKVGYGFAPKSWSDWHYTGSFYWLRHVPHFARNWRAMDYEWFGAESYPSMVYCREDVRPIVARGPLPALDVYQDECMAQRVLPAYMHWRKTGEFVDYRDH